MAPAAVAALKAAICLGAAGAALTRGARGRAARVRAAALGLLVLLGAGAFYDFGLFHSVYRSYGRFDGRAYLHLWDLYHYYLGAKYFPELGYTGLYECANLAEAEQGYRRRVELRTIRDLRNNELVPARYVLEDPER